MSKRLRLAMQKSGRLSDRSRDLLARAGIALPRGRVSTRCDVSSR